MPTIRDGGWPRGGPTARRLRARRRRRLGVVLLLLVLVGALLVVVVARPRWEQAARVRASWRRVGSCHAVGDTAEVVCDGVHLVVLELPDDVAACADHGICSVKVNAEALPAFQGALATAVDEGLGGAIPQFDTINRRRCRDGTDGHWIPNCVSRHSYGLAVDFRPVTDNTNWESVTDEDPAILDVVLVFERYGFRWGGNFSSNFDPQHLEWMPGSTLPTTTLP